MGNSEITLRDRLASLVTAMGYEFVGSELQSNGRNALLRIYIDSENGITVDDCSRVSRQVSAMLDVEDPIQGRYTLEVSSPGLDRPLFEIEHYKKFIGSKIKATFSVPIDGKRKVTGLLLQVEGTNISILVNDVEIMVPFSNIGKANVIADNGVGRG